MLASATGGQNRRLQAFYGDSTALNSASDATKFLATVINSVWTGKIPVQAGTSMGFLVRCWLDAYQTMQADKEKGKDSEGTTIIFTDSATWKRHEENRKKREEMERSRDLSALTPASADTKIST